MQTIYIDRFSVSVSKIELLSNGERIGSATGFFWRVVDELYLVSNWHVFSGRNPKTGQAIDQNSFLVPDALKISFVTKDNLSGSAWFTVLLNSDSGDPRWIQHKLHGQHVDVAAIRIDDLIKYIKHNDGRNAEPFCINEMQSVDDMRIFMGFDVFILGFPLGIMKTNLFPVWKRASVATEYEVDIDGLPCFLVDTATREGMSGAPVIARSFGGFTNTAGGVAMGGSTYDRFLGVYSGRHIGGIDEAHLGIIWKDRIINEIFTDPAKGRFEILP